MYAAASSPSSAAAGDWQSRPVALPDNGDIAINHADLDGGPISFSFTDFLTPASLIWSDDDGRDAGKP